MQERIPIPIARGVEIRERKVSDALERAERAYGELDALYREIEGRIAGADEAERLRLEAQLLEIDRLQEEANAVAVDLCERLTALREEWLDRTLLDRSEDGGG